MADAAVDQSISLDVAQDEHKMEQVLAILNITAGVQKAYQSGRDATNLIAFKVVCQRTQGLVTHTTTTGVRLKRFRRAGRARFVLPLFPSNIFKYCRSIKGYGGKSGYSIYNIIEHLLPLNEIQTKLNSTFQRYI